MSFLNARKKAKEKILILFEGTHLAYAPTVIQLYDALSKKYDVLIIAEMEQLFSAQELSGRNVRYYDYKKKKYDFIYKPYYALLSHISKPEKVLKSKGFKMRVYANRFLLIKRLLGANKYKRIIAVDVKNLFFCSLLNKRCDFLSLELAYEEFLPFAKTDLINCVLIQSMERYNFLFKIKVKNIFLVQNAPIFKEITPQSSKKGLLYGGTASDAFGFYHCLDYLKTHRNEILTVQGAVPYRDKEKIKEQFYDLLTERCLIINDSYLDNDDVVNYFSQFEIGLCFYNFDIDTVDHFNYRSAPSGKLFKYLAAGVPVICSDIIGFKFIKEFDCGILIEDISPRSISVAVKTLRADYSRYAANTITAAKHFSFDNAIKPYLEFIESN